MPVDDALVPSGELAPVDGTPFDFRTARRIGERIDAGHPQLANAGGYDHNFVLDDGARDAAPALGLEPGTMSSARLDGLSGPRDMPDAPGTVASADLDGLGGAHQAHPMRLAARVREPKSGRVMELYTQEPGVQFYSGNHARWRARVRAPFRLLHRAAAFPRLAEPCRLPQHRPASRRNLPHHLRLPLPLEEEGDCPLGLSPCLSVALPQSPKAGDSPKGQSPQRMSLR